MITILRGSAPQPSGSSHWLPGFSLVLLLASLLVGCATGGKPVAVTLEGTKWQLVELNAEAVPESLASRPIDLQLDPNTHQVSGSSGVNRVAGGYQVAGKRISLGPLMGTRMAGTPQAMAFEAEYLKVLGRVDEWAIVDGRLELHAGQEPVAIYRPVFPEAGMK